MIEYLKNEPFPAHLFSVAVSEDPALRYVFAKTHFGEDALGYYCPSDAGLRALVKDAYTQSLDAMLPLILLVAKVGRKAAPAEKDLQDLLTETVRAAAANATTTTFRSKRVQQGNREWGVFEDTPSPNQACVPIVGGAHAQNTWRDIGEWGRYPDADFRRESAEAFTGNDMSRFDCLHDIVCFGAWASRAAEIRLLLPPTLTTEGK